MMSSKETKIYWKKLGLTNHIAHNVETLKHDAAPGDMICMLNSDVMVYKSG